MFLKRKPILYIFFLFYVFLQKTEYILAENMCI